MSDPIVQQIVDKLYAEPVAASSAPAPNTRCTVCREDYPQTGQQTGPVWEVWGPGYRVCRRCRQAGLAARAQEKPQ